MSKEIIEKWLANTEEHAEGMISSEKTILLARPYSMHPDDWYLSVVMAQLPNNEVTPYVTWGFNSHFNSFFDGHYFKDIVEAFDDWKKR